MILTEMFEIYNDDYTYNCIACEAQTIILSQILTSDEEELKAWLSEYAGNHVAIIRIDPLGIYEDGNFVDLDEYEFVDYIRDTYDQWDVDGEEYIENRIAVYGFPNYYTDDDDDDDDDYDEDDEM